MSVVYDPLILSSPQQIGAAIESYSVNNVEFDIYLPKNMGYIYPDQGTPDFVTTYVTLGTIDGLFGFIVPVDKKHITTKLIGTESFSVYGDPLITSFGEWYYAGFVRLPTFDSSSPYLFLSTPPSGPYPQDLGLNYAYRWSIYSSSSSTWRIYLPIASSFLADDIYFPLSYDELSVYEANYNDPAINGYVPLNISPVPKIGLSFLGKRVVIQERTPKTYVALPLPSSNTAIYFEIYLGVSYKPVGGASTENLYTDPTFTLPSLSDINYEDARISVVSFPVSIPPAVYSSFVDNLHNAVSSTPIGQVSGFPDVPQLEYLLQYGFRNISGLTEDVNNALSYLTSWQICRGLIFHRIETGGFLPYTWYYILIDVDRQEAFV